MRLPECTNSLSKLTDYYLSIYSRTTDRKTPIRRVAIAMGDLVDESQVAVDMFTDVEALDREHSLLSAMVDIKDRFGKNAIVKGISFNDKATTRARNLMIGGHNSG